MPKTIPIKPHERSKPSNPAYTGQGNKPGSKTVQVVSYKRSLPKK